MKISKRMYEVMLAKKCMKFKNIVDAGIARGTLCRIVNGEDVRPETIGKLAKVLGCDVTELIEIEK